MMFNNIINAVTDSHSRKTLPTTFIDSIDKRKHIALFYEDLEYAKMTQFRFIKNGLEKGEIGILVTDENIETVLYEMQDFGIDIIKYKDLLHIFPALNSLEEQKGSIECLTKDIQRYLKYLEKPSRLTGNWIHPNSSRARVEGEYERDAYFHDNFEKFNCSVLCCYAQSALHSPSTWVKRFVQIHHSVMFVPSSNEGIAFDV